LTDGQTDGGPRDGRVDISLMATTAKYLQRAVKAKHFAKLTPFYQNRHES